MLNTGRAGLKSQLPKSKSVKLFPATSKWFLLCAGGRGVICRLRPYKSLVLDEHSAYELWSWEWRPVKAAARKHVAWTPWLCCPFSYFISYEPRSAELYLQQVLVKDGQIHTCFWQLFIWWLFCCNFWAFRNDLNFRLICNRGVALKVYFKY